MNTLPFAFEVPKPVCAVCAAARHGKAAHTIDTIVMYAPGSTFEAVCRDLCRPHWRCVVQLHNKRNGT